MKNNKLIYLILILLFIWCCILTAVFVNKEETGQNNTTIINNEINGFSTDMTKVVENIKANTVVIETSNSISSGVIYSQDAENIYIITTYHGIVGSNYNNVIFASGLEKPVELVGYDIYGDIALLKISDNLQVPKLKLGDNSSLKDGEFVISVGTPKNKEYANSVALGMVASNLRTISNSISFNGTNYDYFSDVIQLDCDVTNGYSGAPVYNMNSELIGIITMKDDKSIFVLPVNEIKLIVANILSQEPLTKIQFGIKGSYIKSLASYEKNNIGIDLDINSGLYITNVKSTSLASSLGVKVGDIIQSINDQNINSQNDLLNIAYSNTNEFKLIIIRNGEKLELLGSIND